MDGDKVAALKEGFNSQRDGILRCPKLTPAPRAKCFNSQRDGILRRFASRVNFSVGFQFPTGWNSTLLRLFQRYKA